MRRSLPPALCAFTLVLLTACAGPSAPARPAPSGAGLLIPVDGVAADRLRDSYNDPRPGGRKHWAIDIPAPRGTPVRAAADGVILKLHRGSKGGNAIYQLAPDGRTRYYYAHLDGYARGLAEGHEARRGEVIGYVGDTGNAGRGNYHLHFSIAILSDVRRWWEGTNLNPYPLLRGAAARGARRRSTGAAGKRAFGTRLARSPSLAVRAHPIQEAS